MFTRLSAIPALAVSLLLEAPLAAQDSAQVPEGSNFTLFALGLAGLLIGRRIAMRRQPDDRD